jgi:hypothetical protein
MSNKYEGARLRAFQESPIAAFSFDRIYKIDRIDGICTGQG